MKDRVEKIQPKQIGDWRTTIAETWIGLEQLYRQVNRRHVAVHCPLYTKEGD